MEFLVDSEESQMNNYLIFKEILKNQKEKEKNEGTVSRSNP